MKHTMWALAMLLTAVLAGCAATPKQPAAAAQAQARPVLKFSYPVAERNVILLSPDERSYMLNEMRYYLDMLWVVSDALAHDDFVTVMKSARSRGSVMQTNRLPDTLVAKLPPDFRAFWYSTHRLVDEIADTAEHSENTAATLNKVGVLLQRCNACHALYQFQPR